MVSQEFIASGGDFDSFPESVRRPFRCRPMPVVGKVLLYCTRRNVCDDAQVAYLVLLRDYLESLGS